MSSYDFVLSLGATCRGKYQINRVARNLSVRTVFDWQITSTFGLLQYLERDFTGIFEVTDLELLNGAVFNKALLTLHPHDFPAGMTSTADLLGSYVRARARHSYFAERTRDILTSSHKCLLVLGDPPDDGYTVGDIETALQRYSPTLHFRLLPAPIESGPATPPEEGWQGTDATWDRHLAALLA
jgi:hypothetical protein